MRDYGKISTTIWHSRKFRSLQDTDAQVAYFYLHTCPHVNSIGCFVLPPGYASADLQWADTRWRQALDRLCRALLAGWDEAESLVRIVDFLTHDPFTNPSHAAGAVKLALKLPPSHETACLYMELLDAPHVKDRAAIRQALDRLLAGSPQPVRTQNPNPSPNPSQNPIPLPTTRSASPVREVAPSDWRGQLLNAMQCAEGSGMGDPGDMATAEGWEREQGLTRDDILDVIQAVILGRKPDAPPFRGFAYFTPAMQRRADDKALSPRQSRPQNEAKADANLRAIITGAASRVRRPRQ